MYSPRRIAVKLFLGVIEIFDALRHNCLRFSGVLLEKLDLLFPQAKISCFAPNALWRAEDEPIKAIMQASSLPMAFVPNWCRLSRVRLALFGARLRLWRIRGDTLNGERSFSYLSVAARMSMFALREYLFWWTLSPRVWAPEELSVAHSDSSTRSS